jgi:hypothetical protein
MCVWRWILYKMSDSEDSVNDYAVYRYFMGSHDDLDIAALIESGI